MKGLIFLTFVALALSVCDYSDEGQCLGDTANHCLYSNLVQKCYVDCNERGTTDEGCASTDYLCRIDGGTCVSACELLDETGCTPTYCDKDGVTCFTKCADRSPTKEGCQLNEYCGFFSDGTNPVCAEACGKRADCTDAQCDDVVGGACESACELITGDTCPSHCTADNRKTDNKCFKTCTRRTDMSECKKECVVGKDEHDADICLPACEYIADGAADCPSYCDSDSSKSKYKCYTPCDKRTSGIASDCTAGGYCVFDSDTSTCSESCEYTTETTCPETTCLLVDTKCNTPCESRDADKTICESFDHCSFDETANECYTTCANRSQTDATACKADNRCNFSADATQKCYVACDLRKEEGQCTGDCQWITDTCVDICDRRDEAGCVAADALCAYSQRSSKCYNTCDGLGEVPCGENKNCVYESTTCQPICEHLEDTDCGAATYCSKDDSDENCYTPCNKRAEDATCTTGGYCIFDDTLETGEKCFASCEFVSGECPTYCDKVDTSCVTPCEQRDLTVCTNNDKCVKYNNECYTKCEERPDVLKSCETSDGHCYLYKTSDEPPTSECVSVCEERPDNAACETANSNCKLISNVCSTPCDLRKLTVDNCQRNDFCFLNKDATACLVACEVRVANVDTEEIPDVCTADEYCLAKKDDQDALFCYTPCERRTTACTDDSLCLETDENVCYTPCADRKVADCAADTLCVVHDEKCVVPCEQRGDVEADCTTGNYCEFDGESDTTKCYTPCAARADAACAADSRCLLDATATTDKCYVPCTKRALNNAACTADNRCQFNDPVGNGVGTCVVPATATHKCDLSKSTVDANGVCTCKYATDASLKSTTDSYRCGSADYKTCTGTMVSFVVLNDTTAACLCKFSAKAADLTKASPFDCALEYAEPTSVGDINLNGNAAELPAKIANLAVIFVNTENDSYRAAVVAAITGMTAAQITANTATIVNALNTIAAEATETEKKELLPVLKSCAAATYSDIATRTTLLTTVDPKIADATKEFLTAVTAEEYLEDVVIGMIVKSSTAMDFEGSDFTVSNKEPTSGARAVTFSSFASTKYASLLFFKNNNTVEVSTFDAGAKSPAVFSIEFTGFTGSKTTCDVCTSEIKDSILNCDCTSEANVLRVTVVEKSADVEAGGLPPGAIAGIIIGAIAIVVVVVVIVVLVMRKKSKTGDKA